MSAAVNASVDLRSASTRAVLEVRDLKTWIHGRDGRSIVKAVDGLSFSLAAGESLGIIGESGSGKSMTAMSLMRLLPANVESSGSVVLDGEHLDNKSEAELRTIRGRRIAMILQDPMVALDPLFTIGDQIAAPLRRHLGLKGQALEQRVIELLTAVGIPAPQQRLEQYPHEMSGGMLQRVVGAIALSCDPSVLIADEPTTGLDVTVQAQFLDLLEDLQRRHNLALILITHDLGVAIRVCSRIAVMYAGRIVEAGPVDEVIERPRHPYTEALLASAPHMGDLRRGSLPTIPGSPPPLGELPAGCAFAARCTRVMERCRLEAPPETQRDGRVTRCWLAEQS
jgi:oligopeptide/dipeptide ABC transporter ATP-binding protein